MSRFIHTFLDWDNVGTFGLQKLFDRFQDEDDTSLLIYLVGILPDNINISGDLLCKCLHKSMNKQLCFMFHEQETKNASDFYLCIEIGRLIEQWKTDDIERKIMIISGDTGFEAIPSFVEDIVEGTNLQNRCDVEIWNIHRPCEVSREAREDEDGTQETMDDDYRTNSSIERYESMSNTEANHLISMNDDDNDSFIEQDDFIEIENKCNEINEEEYIPLRPVRPNTRTVRERITRYYDKPPPLKTLLKEWDKLNIPFPIRQKKLLKLLKQIYGNSPEGKHTLRRMLGDQHQGKQSLMVVLTQFLKRHPHHFVVEGKKKVVTLIQSNI